MFQMLMNHGEVEACYLLVNLINKGLIRPPIPEKFTSCHCLDSFGFFPPIKYMFFKCNECNVKICKRCTKYCHRGHDVVEVGNDSCFKCKCSEKGFNKCASIELNVDGNLYIHMNQCMKCCMKIDFQYICKNCAEKCHKEHDNISRIYSQLLNIRTAQNGKNSFKKTSFILIIDTIYYY